MTRVIIESPFAGDVERNLRYLRAAMHDCLANHGEAPFASHGLYTQPGVLDDDSPSERRRGIVAGFAWRTMADRTVVYTDLGISSGMERGIAYALAQGIEVVYRTLPDWLATPVPGHVAVYLTPGEWDRVYRQLGADWRGPITQVIGEAAGILPVDPED